MSQVVTVQFPDSIFARLQKRATRAKRTVEEEVRDAVAAAILDDEIPPEIAAKVASLSTMTDEELWKLGRSHFSAKSAKRLERLNESRRNGKAVDEQELFGLIDEYEACLLLRAHAAAELRNRGHDVAKLFQAQ